jgi:hypothetical protein
MKYVIKKINQEIDGEYITPMEPTAPPPTILDKLLQLYKNPREYYSDYQKEPHSTECLKTHFLELRDRTCALVQCSPAYSCNPYIDIFLQTLGLIPLHYDIGKLHVMVNYSSIQGLQPHQLPLIMYDVEINTSVHPLESLAEFILDFINNLRNIKTSDILSINWEYESPKQGTVFSNARFERISDMVLNGDYNPRFEGDWISVLSKLLIDSFIGCSDENYFYRIDCIYKMYHTDKHAPSHMMAPPMIRDLIDALHDVLEP